MVKRKEIGADRKEKVKLEGPASRRVSKKVDFDTLPDAVQNGKLVPTKGQEVLFERTKEGKVTVCVGTIVSIHEGGGVDVWDETFHEFFLFNVNRADKVRVKVSP